MAEPVYGARYLKPAGSEAGAATMVVYSMAPASSSAPLTRGDRRALLADRDVDAAHLLVDGSPDSQLAFWLMIVSIAMAVLPVWRSPMMSWRWPRPIGIIASMALMPVCSGSCTDLRCMTPGACSSRARRPSMPVISPRPSIGVAERVDDTAEVALADGNGEDLAGAGHLHALFDAGELAEHDDADLVFVEVQREAERAVREADELVRHDRGQALDVGDAVGGVGDVSDLGLLRLRPARTTRRTPREPNGSRRG